MGPASILGARAERLENRDAVGLAVGASTGRDNGGVEQVVAQLLAQPDEVPYVGRTGDTAEHHLEGHHPLVAPLDD
jgi:hypothetical protein